MVDLSHAVWRKSTLSSTSNCIEVAMAQDPIAIRDSKDRTGPTLSFSPSDWQAFIGEIQEGEFNLPRPSC